jgi:hypothetical protein
VPLTKRQCVSDLEDPKSQVTYLESCQCGVDQACEEQQRSTAKKTTRVFWHVIEHAAHDDGDDTVPNYCADWDTDIVADA